MKVLLITNIIAPYRVPVFNSLAAVADFELKVLFCARTEHDREWQMPANLNFTSEVIDSRLIRIGARRLYVSLKILARIWQYKPDIILTGGFSVPTLYAWLYCILLNRDARYILFGEGTIFTESGVKGIELLLRTVLVRQSAACVAASSDAKDYFVSLGAIPESVFLSLLTTDVSRFSSVCRAMSLDVQRLRKQLGSPESILLYSGRLTQLKGVWYLLEAFSLVRRRIDNVALIILGSGNLEDELKRYCEQNLIPAVHFMGFKQQDELPIYFSVADLFVFPTLLDRFGVVIVEAIAAGLPIICSKFAGAARDLVSHGKNGYIVDPRDTAQIAEYMAEILDDDQLRAKMGQESINMREKCSVERAVDGFVQAIRSTWRLRNPILTL